MLKTDETVRSIAQDLYQKKSLLIMGRGYNYSTCMEGALVRLGVVCFLKAVLFSGIRDCICHIQ